ncbi:MAG: hypothetical protein JWN18_477 [Parcubacteria group bacterium]|nr:hypothetical protein [Parcubacteria group bacterium]
MLYINLSQVPGHLKHHAGAFVLALIVGILTVAPYLYFAITTPNYTGISLMGQDAEEHYLARIHESYEGNITLGNTFTSYKNTPYTSAGAGEAFEAAIAKLTSLTIPAVSIAAKFVFPLLVFLVLYGFGIQISHSRVAAMTGATLGMLGSDFMSNFREFIALLHFRSITDGITWARPINPPMSDLLLFSALWLLYRICTHEARASKVTLVALGAIIGISLYISPYIWSYLGVVLLLLFIYEVSKKNYMLAFDLSISGVIGLLAAIPLALSHLNASTQPGYDIAAQFLGSVTSHVPVFGVWLLVLLLLPFLMWPLELRPSRPFFIMCGISLFIALNQQVLSGFYLQPGHYHWYITKPLAGLLLGLILVILLMRYAGAHGAIVFSGAVATLLFIHAGLAQHNFYVKNAPMAVAAQTYASLFTDLNQHVSLSVYADRTLSDYIPIYTNDDAPGSWYAGFYVLPPDYLKHRLFLEYRLRGISVQNCLATLKNERDAVAYQLYGGNWSSDPSNKEAIPDAVLESLAHDYESFVQTKISTLMRALSIDALVVDAENDAWSIKNSDLRLDRIINERFAIYLPFNSGK